MKIYAWKTGAALAIAVILGYGVLTALFAFWPFAGQAFTEALSTGAGFDPTQGKISWSPGAFAYASALLAVWAFATGALFSWVHTFLHQSDK